MENPNEKAAVSVETGKETFKAAQTGRKDVKIFESALGGTSGGLLYVENGGALELWDRTFQRRASVEGFGAPHLGGPRKLIAV